MSSKLNGLAAAAAIAVSTAAAAQTQPATTETKPATTQTQPTTTTTTTQTPPATQEAQPATTTTTTQTPPPADQANAKADAAAQGGASRAATADDLKVGASVYDKDGGLVGKIEKVEADGAIVATGKARAEIPLASFGVGQVPALIVGTTRAELEAQAKTKATTKAKSK